MGDKKPVMGERAFGLVGWTQLVLGEKVYYPEREAKGQRHSGFWEDVTI